RRWRRFARRPSRVPPTGSSRPRRTRSASPTARLSPRSFRFGERRLELLEKLGIGEVRVLAAHRIFHRVIEAVRPFPLVARPDMAVAADLVEAPIDFEPVAVGVAELDRDLHAGAAAALEIDLDLMLVKVNRGAQHL